MNGLDALRQIDAELDSTGRNLASEQAMIDAGDLPRKALLESGIQRVKYWKQLINDALRDWPKS